MSTKSSLLLMLVWLTSCASSRSSFVTARAGFSTSLIEDVRQPVTLPTPPAELFTVERYRGPAGALHAVLSRPTKPGKQAVMVWLSGGFPPGGIDETGWKEAPSDNDQSAAQYRQAGLVTMYPTLRGADGNDGRQESLLGEVDDVLAALAHLRALPFVDADQLYLGGHSTGATLALLTAAAGAKVRGVMALGPVEDVCRYPPKQLTFDPSSERECAMRAPGQHLDDIAVPTVVIEGQQGNLDSLMAMKAATKNPKLQFYPVVGASHFDLLAPINRLLAAQVQRGSLELTQPMVQHAYDARAGQEALTLGEGEPWSITLPGGFQRIDTERARPVYRRGAVVIDVVPVGKLIGKGCSGLAANKPGSSSFTERWREHELCVVRQEQKTANEKTVLVYVALLPFAPQALALTIASPQMDDALLLSTLRETLPNVDGEVRFLPR